ncbi:MAG: hypothetical protein AAGL23_07580 [Pseudomonadota bacterium]
MLANVIVFIGGAACLLTALGAYSSFVIYRMAAAQQDVPLTLLLISLVPTLILIGTAMVTLWVYKLKDDAIWLSAAMATSPAWPFIVANLDPTGRFIESARLSDIGFSWIWSAGFLLVALYMNTLKSKGMLTS